jgi:predicted O-methyltransferase YrrM
MHNRLSLTAKYLRYYLTAQNRHDIHSPFVYNLTTKVIHPDKNLETFKAIEQQRKLFLRNKATIPFLELGAGKPSTTKAINDIASGSLKPPRYARLLYRLAQFYQPTNIIELGTSLGITTAYFALSQCPEIYTLEGNDAVAQLAQIFFERSGINNQIHLIKGNFDETLPRLMQQLKHAGMVFFDGNHQYAATINYFEQCLPYINQHSIFIFDDINYSSDMQKAWHEMIKHPKVTVSVDLLMLGILFFDGNLSKQHFTIRY